MRICQHDETQNETMMSDAWKGMSRSKREVHKGSLMLHFRLFDPVDALKWEGLIWSLNGNPTQELQEIN